MKHATVILDNSLAISQDMKMWWPSSSVSSLLRNVPGRRKSPNWDSYLHTHIHGTISHTIPNHAHTHWWVNGYVKCDIHMPWYIIQLGERQALKTLISTKQARQRRINIVWFHLHQHSHVHRKNVDVWFRGRGGLGGRGDQSPCVVSTAFWVGKTGSMVEMEGSNGGTTMQKCHWKTHRRWQK